MIKVRDRLMTSLGGGASIFAGALLAAVVWSPAPVLADDPDGPAGAGHSHDPTNVWAIARGGQPYD